jgi:hypothetical protein
MKRFLVLVVLLGVAAPAAFAAPPAGKGNSETSATSSSGQGPAALCKVQRRTMGMSAFRALYAPTGSPKAAFDACLAKESTLVATDTKNAAMKCKADRANDPEGFKTTWGLNGNGANAFGKCVSATARGLTSEQQQATLSAAASCKTERGTTADSVKAFNEKYGTGNKKNAFGKCVAATKKKQNSGG